MASNSSSSGGGGIGLTTLISGIYAYATIPSLTGLKGAFAAAMTGFGTSLVAGLYGLGGGALGAAFGGAVGALGGRAKEGAVIGTIVCGLGSTIYGISQGYGAAKDIIVNGTLPETAVSEVISAPANDNAVSGKSFDMSHLQKRFPGTSVAMPS